MIFFYLRGRGMKECVYCREIIGDSASKCFSCGKEQPLKTSCYYQCRECGAALERPSDKCRLCGGDAESVRPYATNVSTSNSDSIGCIGCAIAVIFTPLSCIIAIICYCSTGSEKAKRMAQIGAFAALCWWFLGFFLRILL